MLKNSLVVPVVLIACSMSHPGVAVAQPQEDIRSAIDRLAKELRITRDEPPDRFRQAVAAGGPQRLKNLLSRITARTLNDDPGASAAAIEEHLKDIYNPWEGTWTVETGRLPLVLELSKGSSTRTLFVAWLLRIGGDAAPDTLPLLEVYELRSGAWVRTVEYVDFPRDHGLFVHALTRSAGAPPSVLLWGRRFGSMHSELAVVIIHIESKRVRPIWSAMLSNGELTLTPDGMRLEFRELTSLGPHFKEITEDWVFTAKGVERKSRVVK